MKQFYIIFSIIFFKQSVFFAQNFVFSPLLGGLYSSPKATIVYKNKLYIGGSFEYADTLKVNGICSWDGNNFRKVSGGIDISSINCFTIYNDLLLMGGYFSQVIDTNGNWIISKKLVGWDGNNWVPFNLNNDASTNNISSMTVFQGDLYICGLLQNGNIPIHWVGKWDGTAWHDIGINVIDYGGTPKVRVLTVFNNELYAGGSFSKINGVEAFNIARWDGSQWLPVGSGTTGSVVSFYPDTINNVLWVGGGLFEAGGIPTHSVALWDGQQWSIPGQSTMWGAMAITKYNNLMFVGNPYNGPGTSACSYWNGTVWDSIIQFTSTDIYCITEFQGALYIGGTFQQINSTPMNYIVKMQMTNNASENDLEKKNLLENNIPNPFSQTTKISYNIPTGIKEAYLSINNIFGKHIETILLDLQKTQVEINMNKIINGVYIYSLIVDGKIIETRKMIMIDD